MIKILKIRSWKSHNYQVPKSDLKYFTQYYQQHSSSLVLKTTFFVFTHLLEKSTLYVANMK